MKGIMSQNFDSGPSFYFMKCRRLYIKNVKKLPVIWHKSWVVISPLKSHYIHDISHIEADFDAYLIV